MLAANNLVFDFDARDTWVYLQYVISLTAFKTARTNIEGINVQLRSSTMSS